MRPPGRRLLRATTSPTSTIAMTELWREAVGALHRDDRRTGPTWSSPRPASRYRASARFDDELELSASDHAPRRHVDHHRAYDRARGRRALLTEGELRHVFVDPETIRQAARCPSAVRTAWSASRPQPPDGPPAHRRPVGPRRSRSWTCSARPPAVTNVVRLPGAARKPDGDLILCDVAREDASVVIGDLKELGMPRDGLDRGGADRQLDLRRRPAAERAAPGLPSDAVVWEEVEARTPRAPSCRVSFLAFMVARDADRRRRHRARPADPDRRGHGGGPGVRSAGRGVRGAGPAAGRPGAALADRAGGRASRSASLVTLLTTLVLIALDVFPDDSATTSTVHRLHLEPGLLLSSSWPTWRARPACCR